MPKRIFRNSIERSRKLSKAMKGNTWGFQKGNKICIGRIPWNKGKRMKKEWIEKAIKTRTERGFKPTLGKHWKLSDETKLKMKKPKPEETRKKMVEAKKGENNPMYGTHCNKMENHPNWQGGKSFESYGLEFNKDLKEQIRQRDNHICKECGEKQSYYKFPIHHIDYNKQNNKADNLITLCRNCHSQTNFQREDWADYFKNKIKL